MALKLTDYDGTAGFLRIHAAKGGRKRLQPVPAALAADIVHRAIQDTISAKDNTYFFPGRHQLRPLSARQAQVLFTNWKRLSGIRPELTIRSLRAGFATMLYRTTGNIGLVAQALGHAGLQTVRRYVQMDADKIRTAIETTFQSTSLSARTG